MQIEVFNVEHGQCSVVTLPNGKKIMVDAGHNATKPWRPSEHFSGTNIEELIISNFDEDHAIDFANVQSGCFIHYITVNQSVEPQTLRRMKTEGGMGNGIKAVYDWWSQVSIGEGSGFPDYGNATVTQFWNTYGDPHTDENNLSVVTFVEWNGFSICFPGDLEEKGWRTLLTRSDFREKLANVTVLVASHHGRENGCCEEVFDYYGATLCQPKCVIISDAGIQHATQATRDWYKKWCQSCITTNNKPRWVLSTCNDGNIKIEVKDNRSWNIETNYSLAANATTSAADIFASAYS